MRVSGRQAATTLLHIGRIDQRDLDAQAGQRAEQTIGVAENMLAADQVIARLQQGEKGGGQRRHARGKLTVPSPLFHFRYLGFQRRGGRRTLPCIGKPALPWKTAASSRESANAYSDDGCIGL